MVNGHMKETNIRYSIDSAINKGEERMKTPIAWIDDVDLIHLNIKNSEEFQVNKDQPFIVWKKENKEFKVKMIEKINDTTIRLRIFEALPMGEELFLIMGRLEIPVYPGAIVRTHWFDQIYGDPDTVLGSIYLKHATTFRVWAPTAISVVLYVDKKAIQLRRKKKGIWQTEVSGDLNGLAYDYGVTVNGQCHRVNDPYAKAMLANSEKAVVVDLNLTDPPHFKQTKRPKVDHLQDAIIYELHVRDATIQEESGATYRGKYLGLTEQDTRSPKGHSSGLSYFKELGVTHVQLLPINDFARVNEINPENDYNWGYDPLFFQVPEGSYATSAEEATTRIRESKQMIQAFHEAGLSVILDVVYNHVFIIEESAFELIVPGYYFRYHEDGTLSDGTGVGNDFASERLMARKFILDTVDFWLSEYRIDGFRFDLMGAMDIETMKVIHERCQLENQPIMLLGEGWNLATALPTEQKAMNQNSHQLQGYRFFNDYFRDTVKGNFFNLGDQGFVNGGGKYKERLASLMTASAISEFGTSIFSDVNQTINFVEVHDNYTLWDQLKVTNKNDNETTRRHMHKLATGITLLAQGVPFIHAGQEWFRTKQGDGNSYLSGDDVNQLDWHARDRETENIAFVKALISLRKKYDVFRLTSKDFIRERVYILNTPGSVFGMVLMGDNEDIVIYINPTASVHTLQLPSTGQWQLALTSQQPRQDPIGDFLDIDGYELMVLLKIRG